MPRQKIYPAAQLAEILKDAKTKGKTIVTTNGCFDVLHLGHLRYLQAAREVGDLLIVCVNSDSSVRALKGADRPLVPEVERAELLAGLECVDYVTVFSERDANAVLSRLKPDIHIKGGDYKIDEVIERAVVEANGGKVMVGLNVPGKSTTNLIKTIRDKYGVE
jgi:rfaE bifunctional protein nucleotidyltransferase chain/domain